MTLRRKLMLYMLPIMLISIAAIGYWGMNALAVALKQSTREEAVKQTESMAWMIKKQLVYSEMQNDDVGMIEDMMHDLTRDDEQLVLLDQDGNRILKESSESMKHFNTSLFDGTQKTISRYTRFGDRIILTVSTRFDVMNQEWYLNRSTDVSHLDKVYEEYTFNTMVFFIVIALMTLASVFGSSKQITDPIRNMIDDMKVIQSSNQNIRVQVSHYTELEALGQTFNELMDNVEERHQKLIHERDIRQNFIDSLRHEMRTPLTSIIGYSDLIRKDIPSHEEQIESAKTIYEEASRLQAMSDALLYGLMAKGELATSNVNLDKLAMDIVKTYRTRLDEKVLCIVSKVELEEIEAEPILLFQAIGNLVDNAIKASPHGSEILIKIDETGISVRDYGNGINQSAPENEIGSGTIRSEGYGLGLHIVREIAVAHGWTFRLTDGPDRGATAMISF